MITLRYSAAYNCPNDITYIQAFQNAGWTIKKKTVLLDFSSQNPLYVNPLTSSNVLTQPTNVPAKQVQQHFGLI